jgi:MSHA pilin protein MshC
VSITDTHNRFVRFYTRGGGFSLIELVTVIVIIGVLAAFAVPKLATSFSGFERYAFRQELLAGLRYAQKTAVAAGCPVRVDLYSGAESFQLDYQNDSDNSDTDCGDGSDVFDDPVPVPDPTGGNFTREAGSGADLTSGDELVFEGNGSLRSDSDATIGLANRPDIEVNSVTGYVQE